MGLWKGLLLNWSPIYFEWTKRPEMRRALSHIFVLALEYWPSEIEAAQETPSPRNTKYNKGYRHRDWNFIEITYSSDASLIIFFVNIIFTVFVFNWNCIGTLGKNYVRYIEIIIYMSRYTKTDRYTVSYLYYSKVYLNSNDRQ